MKNMKSMGYDVVPSDLANPLLPANNFLSTTSLAAVVMIDVHNLVYFMMHRAQNWEKSERRWDLLYNI